MQKAVGIIAEYNPFSQKDMNIKIQQAKRTDRGRILLLF